MLLRLNFFGGQARQPWIQAHMPSAVYIHAKRMGFKQHLSHLPDKERKATDSIEYAHFVWTKDVFPRWTKTRVI